MITSESLPCATIFRFPQVFPVNNLAGWNNRSARSQGWSKIQKQLKRLPTSGQAKDVSIVCFNQRIVKTDEYVAMLIAVGKIPCKMAPSYLLGLMKRFSEAEMPLGLRDKNIIAVEPLNPASMFTSGSDKKEHSSWLSVRATNDCLVLFIPTGNGEHGKCSWLKMGHDDTNLVSIPPGGSHQGVFILKNS